MGLVERINKNIDNKYWDSDEVVSFPVKNRYTAGLAGQKFLEGIKEEERIYGTYCPYCQLTFVPGKLYCERCFAELSEWIDVGTRGEIYTYTVSYVEKDDTQKESPSIVAVIKIADGYLVHWLENCNPGDVEIGMQVKANFKPEGERKGSILDISGFQPA